MISSAELLVSLEMGLIYGIVAIGIYLTFKVIDFPDLTCDGSFTCGAAASALMLKSGFGPVAALVAALLFGGIAGVVTGILHTYCRISNLLAGILVAFMLYSINLKIMGGIPNVALMHEPSIFKLATLDLSEVALIIYPVIVMLLIAGLIWFCCSYLMLTDFGLALRSIGQNKRLAIIGGVQISAMTIAGLALSNALIGLSGGLFSQHQGFADISQGVGTVIIGFAAVIIGEKILPLNSMFAKILACLLGSILYRLIIAFALHSEWLGLETQDLNLITGLIVVVIMWLSKFKPNQSTGGSTC